MISVNIGLNHVHVHLIEVRPMNAKEPSKSRKNGKKKSEAHGTGNFAKTTTHRVYGNPFQKKAFNVSQSTLTDSELVARRIQMEWFESAQIDLRYF